MPQQSTIANQTVSQIVPIGSAVAPQIDPINPNEIAKQDSSTAAILALTIFSVLSLNAMTGLIRVILVSIDRYPPSSR